MSESDTEALIRRAKDGDREAWATLVDSFRPRLERRAKRLLDARFPHRSSSELAQVAIIRVTAAQSKFHSWDTPENTVASLHALLLVTLTRLAINWGQEDRRQKRTPPGPPVPVAVDTSDSANPPPADPTPPPPPELLLDLSAALDLLDDVSRTLVVGVHFERRSHKELAAKHGLSEDVVHKRLTDARRRLGTLLREWE